MEAASSPNSDSTRWHSLALALAFVTVAWNVTEALVAVLAAYWARSPVLLGFGLDSVVESLSGLVMVWRFLHLDRATQREAIALRLAGGCLILLALFVSIDAARTLAAGTHPEVSVIGIVLAIVSLIVMPILAYWKRRAAVEIGSGALHTDAKQTDICWMLAAVLLAGVGLNALFGWWWADPMAALAMVPLIAYEGWQALRGRSACGQCG